jgi:TolB protein
MESVSSKRFFQTFDKFMIAGLGCGVIGLCCLASAFVYTFANPANAHPAITETLAGTTVISTVTPGPMTPTLSIETSTPFPTLTPGAPTEAGISTPVPNPDTNNSSLAGRIVFTCYVQQIDQICIMNADGSGRKQLTHFSATTFYPSLSPDGKTIYFVSKEKGTFDIYSMALNGGDVERMTKDIGALYAPELSPNGKRIVFTKDGGGIWVMRADGNNPHAITFKDDIDPTWSPDGSKISFASSRKGDRQLFMMDANGDNVVQLTDLKNMGGRSTWSPDGTKIAFYRGPQGDHNIYIVDVNTKDIKKLTNGGDNLGPSWSPDGDWIAFTSFRDGNNEIYIIHPDGSGLRRLTENPVSDWQPRWGR